MKTDTTGRKNSGNPKVEIPPCDRLQNEVISKFKALRCSLWQENWKISATKWQRADLGSLHFMFFQAYKTQWLVNIGSYDKIYGK